MFEILPTKQFNLRTLERKVQQNGWKVKQLDIEMMDYMIDNIGDHEGDAEQMTKQVMQSIANVCDAAIPRKGRENGRVPNYWWNVEIARLRKECLKLRRKHQRARGNGNFEHLQAEFKEKRKELRKAITKSKSEAFRILRDELDNNPWGNAYKIVLTKIKGVSANAPVCPDTMANIVAGLFPKQSRFNPPSELQVDKELIPPVTDEEVVKAVERIKTNKTPGLDGIPNIVLKTVIKTKPDIFSRLYTTCLQEGIFPQRWKHQRLVLIPKGTKSPEDPSSHRPLCMLDTAGKILERIICSRLEMYTEGPAGLSQWQYGFRKKRSAVDAVEAVCEIARHAMDGKRWLEGSKQYCAVVALDVKNAFNSANWNQIFSALMKMHIPNYLLRMVASYFTNRILFYDTEEGPKDYRITGGVPQGSVLGPLLWNIMYDAILKIRNPKEVTIIGYADDIAIVVVGKKLPDVAKSCNDTISKVSGWLQSVGLQLAEHKTEAVLMSSRKKLEKLNILIGGHSITSSPHIKYLGVLLDHRLTFKEHLRYASDKATKVGAALARLMPNIGGPRQESRKLLASVNTSILMYAAPIWTTATNYKTYMMRLTSAHRLMSLRVCSAFRTVSDDAICVIAGSMPIGMKTKEARAIRNARKHRITMESLEHIQSASQSEWQERWDASIKGRWTHVLIPDIEKWINRKHGEVNYHLTQFISGHGCFREYLYKYRHVSDPYCLYCTDKVENAEHALMECVRFEDKRYMLEQQMRMAITPGGLIRYMLTSETAWNKASKILVEIMNRIRHDEQKNRSIVATTNAATHTSHCR